MGDVDVLLLGWGLFGFSGQVELAAFLAEFFAFFLHAFLSGFFYGETGFSGVGNDVFTDAHRAEFGSAH